MALEDEEQGIRQAADFELGDYVSAARSEDTEWDNFFHSFSKAKSFTEAAGDVLEQMIPLGRIQVTDPDTGELSIKHIPPSEDLKAAAAAGDTELAANILNFERDQRLQARFSHLYTDEGEQRKNTDNALGTFVGYLADPTTLIPFAAGWKGAAASGAALGAGDMAMFSKAENGEVDLGDVALGMVFGAAAPTVLKGVGKAVGRHEWQDSQRAARTMLDKYERKVLEHVKSGYDLDFAQVKAAQQAGFRNGMVDVAAATEKAGRLPTIHKGLTPAIARDSLSQFELTASQKFLNKYGFLKSAAEKADYYLGSMSTRLKKADVKLFNAVRKADLETHVQTHSRMERVDKWTHMVNRLQKKDPGRYKQLHSALVNRRFKSAFRVFRELEGDPAYAGIREEFLGVRKVLQEMAIDAEKAGYKLKWDNMYFPRVVRNAEAIGVQRKSLLAKALLKAEKAQGRKLTAGERKVVIEKHIEANPPATQKEAGHVKKRVKREVNDEELEFYAGLNDSLISYIQAMTHSIERRKFIRANSRKMRMEPNDVLGRDLNKGIADIIDSRRKKMGWTAAEENEVMSLLMSRFGPGEKTGTRFWHGFKNITYSFTLGNIMSALTQLGDNAFGMIINGVRPQLRATLTGIAPGKLGERLVDKTMIGLSEISDDIFNDATRSKKWLDFTLKWSGFSNMDKFGKNNLINGSLLKAKKLANAGEKGRRKFVEKWGGVFGEETLPLMKKLQNFKKGDELDDNMRLFLWHNLSDAQPIGLSEMPQAYLNHPNGRVFYMLKTFTIKQFDLMRREIFQDAAAGNLQAAASKMASFVTLFTLINGSVDELKNAMRGKEFTLQDAAVNNMARLVGLSAYQFDNFSKEGPMETIAKTLLPPFPIDSVYKAAVNKKPEDLLKQLPGLGRGVEALTK